MHNILDAKKNNSLDFLDSIMKKVYDTNIALNYLSLKTI